MEEKLREKIERQKSLYFNRASDRRVAVCEHIFDGKLVISDSDLLGEILETYDIDIAEIRRQLEKKRLKSNEN